MQHAGRTNLWSGRRLGSAQGPLERAASGLAEIGADEGLEEASLPDGGGVLDVAEFAGWGRRAGRSRTGAGRGGVLDAASGRRSGRRGGGGGRSRTGAGWGGVLDAAKRAPAEAACWMQPGGRRPGRHAGCSRAGVGRGDEVEAGVGRGDGVEAGVGQGGWGVGRCDGVDACVGRREGCRGMVDEADAGAAGWIQGAGA
ncbi:hypothetical protein SORBI_3008G045232 [Sorghum bicolor]|uniref:Uncharacterized protein n=1 Tax=Sorghum bicolor TaxID=4558 RepID=A0A1Z5R4Y0_SORBI|nr:hypothetical protein SORBI_3008G045232 [Sorghum bicolor]